MATTPFGIYRACRLATFAAAGLILSSCGESTSVETTGFDLTFGIDQSGSRVSCTSVSEITSFEVTLLLPNGQTRWPGFPMVVDCASGAFSFQGVTPGEYLIDLKARGSLDGDDMAILYSAVEPITIPSNAPIDVVLTPEVGFLDLSWTFGDDELAPCATEVGAIEVVIGSPGSQVGSFMGRFTCTEPPIRVPRSFAPQEYVIRVVALSPQDDLPLFRHTTERFLVRGDNAYAAVLEPLGGRLNLDWQFAVGADEFTDCDAPVVGVSDVSIEIQSREGGGGVDRATAACVDAPYAFVANRYTQDRRLTAVLTAEGEHYFEARQDFVMPAGDYDSGRITLHAVGTATLAVGVRTATCAEDMVVGYAVTVRGPTDFATQVEGLAPGRPFAALSGLRYGAYEIEVEQQTVGGIQCRARGQRRIGSRDNDWTSLEF